MAAAGNYGRTADGRSVYGAITTPGNSPYALTVGAVDTHGTPQRSDDTLAPYSSKGPTRYDLVLKPDVVGAGQPRRLGGGAGRVSGDDVSGAARGRDGRERVHAAVGDEHGGRASSAARWRCCSRNARR